MRSSSYLRAAKSKARTWSWTEILGCQVLCANCHRLETWRTSLDRTQPPTVVREPRRGSHDLVVPGQGQKDVDYRPAIIRELVEANETRDGAAGLIRQWLGVKAEKQLLDILEGGDGGPR